MVDEHQLKARIADSDVLRADVRVQVERLVARVRVAGQASAAVCAVSAEAAAVWICQVAVSTIIANSVVRVTLARAIQKTLYHITCGMNTRNKLEPSPVPCANCTCTRTHARACTH